MRGLLLAVEQELRHAAIAIGVAVVGFEKNGAVVGIDGLLAKPQPHQRIAKIGQRRRKVRVERDRLVQAFAGLIIALQPEQRRSEIGVRFRGAGVEAHRASKPFLRLIEPATIEFRNAKQMQRIKMVRQVMENLPAQRLNFRLPALAISRDRGRQQDLSLLPVFLLQPRVHFQS